jgi:hypothetical protein
VWTLGKGKGAKLELTFETSKPIYGGESIIFDLPHYTGTAQRERERERERVCEREREWVSVCV